MECFGEGVILELMGKCLGGDLLSCKGSIFESATVIAVSLQCTLVECSILPRMDLIVSALADSPRVPDFLNHTRSSGGA